MTPDERYGYLCGTPLDRNRMACVLPVIEGEVNVYVKDKDEHKMFVLDDGRNLVVLMGMKDRLDGDDDYSREWAEAPRFPKEIA